MSVTTVMPLDTWMNAAWRMSFRSIHHGHWPLFLWHLWHHSLQLCKYILSLILLFLYYLTVTWRKKPNILAVLQCNCNSRMFIWWVQLLHMHIWIIMTHNLVTEIKKKLTGSNIGKQLSFHHYQTSTISVCICILPRTQESSPSVRQNPISI
jgi:hypothetical protein